MRLVTRCWREFSRTPLNARTHASRPASWISLVPAADLQIIRATGLLGGQPRPLLRKAKRASRRGRRGEMPASYSKPSIISQRTASSGERCQRSSAPGTVSGKGSGDCAKVSRHPFDRLSVTSAGTGLGLLWSVWRLGAGPGRVRRDGRGRAPPCRDPGNPTSGRGGRSGHCRPRRW